MAADSIVSDLVMVAIALGLGIGSGVVGHSYGKRRNGNGKSVALALKTHEKQDEVEFEKIRSRLLEGDGLFRTVRGDQGVVAALLVDGDSERQAKLKFARPDFYRECVAPRLRDFRLEKQHRGRNR